MKGWNIFVMAMVLWLAGALQMGLSPWLAIHSMQPDFLLVAMGCLCMFTGQAGGAVLGFFAGLIWGAAAHEGLGQHIASRTLTGFLAGWLNSLEIKPTAIVAAVSTALITLCARLVFFFMDPPAAHQLGAYLQATLGCCVYNALLAAPAFLLTRSLLGGSSRRYR